MKFIKELLEDARNGHDKTSKQYLAFTIYAVLCLVIGGVVPITKVDWSSFVIDRLLYGVIWVLIAVLALSAVGSSVLAYLARKGEKERANPSTTCKTARSN